MENRQKIVIATDAWEPQTNGVVTTFTNILPFLRQKYDVHVIHPGLFWGFNFPFYKEIKLTLPFKLTKMLDNINPDHIHIVTEGPIGLAAKRYCHRNNRRHTTSFHTNFALFCKENFRIPESLTWKVLRWFHSSSTRILVTNNDMKSELYRHGFDNDLVVWARGYDSTKFYIRSHTRRKNPVIVCVSRISKEKNLEQFCQLSETVKYTCILAGDGSQLNYLKSKYNKVQYYGCVDHDHLGSIYSEGDVFFFPSKFDTFGIVMLESIACGVPVIAYDTIGPRTVVNKDNGVLINDISEFDSAVETCLTLHRYNVANSVKNYTWENAAEIFVKSIV